MRKPLIVMMLTAGPIRLRQSQESEAIDTTSTARGLMERSSYCADPMDGLPNRDSSIGTLTLTSVSL